MGEHTSEIELGATYRDAVSGFEGVAVSTTLFLFACERVYLSQGHKKDDGKELGAVFDAAQLTRVKGPEKRLQKKLADLSPTAEPPAEPKAKKKAAPRKTGGARPTPSAIR